MNKQNNGSTTPVGNTKVRNANYVRRVMRDYASHQYRIAKETPDIVAKEVDKYIKKITFVSAEIAMNSGRCIIRPKDVLVAIKVLSSEKQ